MAAIAYPMSLSTRRGKWSTSSQFTPAAKHPVNGLLRLVKPSDSAVVSGVRHERPAIADIRYIERPMDAVLPVPVRRVAASRAAVQHRRRVIARRRLVVSTFLLIGIFVGLWAGTGAISGSRSGSMVRLAGSVSHSGGYLYTVRAGDTLWSIATRLNPTGDPRPLVNSLDAQLDGGALQVGSQLLVP